jgi:hypothetical protein
MARTIHTIEAVASSASMEVDRDEGIIRGVKILGLVSDNNRKYMPEAVRKAKSLYEGIKVNINHPAESGDVRNAEDRFGKLINVKYVEGEGLYGDLMFLKSHPMAERICEAAERNDMNDTFGLSHNAQGDGQEDDQGCFVVSSIVEVRHVDLVADPATTKSLREARTRMKATESNQISSDIVSLEKQFENAVKQMHSINAGVSNFIKSNDVGPNTKQKFTKIRSDLSNAINVANKVKTDLVHMLHPGADGSANFSEGEDIDNEEEEMTEAEEKLTKLQIHSRRMKNDPEFRAAQQKMARDADAETAAQIMAQKKREREGGGYQAEIFLNGRPYKDSRILKSKAEAEKFGKMYEKEESDVGQKYTYKVKKVDVYGYTVKESDGQEEEPIADEEMPEAAITNRYKSSIANRLSGQHVSKDVLMKYINDGKIEAEMDLTPRKAATIRDSRTNERFSVFVEGEDEMMTESDDMPVEDPSEEEEMTEAISLPDKQEARDFINQSSLALHKLIKMLKGVEADEDSAKAKQAIKTIGSTTDKIIKELSSLDAQLLAASAIKESEVEDPSEEEMTEGDGSSGDGSSYVIQQWEDGKFNKQGGPEYPTRAAAQAVADKGKAKLHPSLRDGGVEYRVVKIDRRGKVIKEADDMPMDEADDELAIEAEDDYTEEEYSGDEDKMAMESKRRLQRFCKTNGVVLTEGLLKDLKPLTEAAQKRCILRIKLASKARKPKSSGSMMPMTESKVHTGDNVFNWLRS